MKEIGGYFELELNNTGSFHSSAIAVNSGRNAFEMILTVRRYKKVFLPFFFCDVLLEPLKKLEIEVKYYDLQENWLPEFDFQQLNSDSCLLYINYFGINLNNCQYLASVSEQICFDFSQAFFDQPIQTHDTFYSPRKFFGVPDGGYVFLKDSKTFFEDIEDDNSTYRTSHLFLRREKGASAGYHDFLMHEEQLKNCPISKMSKSTVAILNNIDYSNVTKKRKKNFDFLKDKLQESNKIIALREANQVPMNYPYLIENVNLKQFLIKNKIYVPTFWPNVLDNAPKNSYSFFLATFLNCLPVDQRYDLNDMDYVFSKIDSL